MNDEQNKNVEGTVVNSAPENTPSIVPDTHEEMTTAIVNPDFMAEVEAPAEPALESAPVMPETVNQTVAPLEPTKPTLEKKKRGINKIVLIVIIVLAVIIVAVGVYVGYLFKGVNPKSVHDKVINQMFASVDKFADKLTINYNPDAKTIKTLSKITLNTNMDEFSMLNDYSLRLEQGFDKENNFINYKLNFLEKSKELLDINYYLMNNKTYLESKALYDKVIEIGDYSINTEDLINTYDTFNNENLSYLIEVLQKGFKNSLQDGKYDRKLETVKLGGKEVKAFNNSYVIDEATAYAMSKSILTAFVNDDKALQIIADMINSLSSSMELYDEEIDVDYSDSAMKEISKDDVKSMLNEMIKEFEDPELSGSGEKIYFNVYSSVITNDVIGVKLIENDGKNSVTIIDYYEDGDVSNFKINFSEDNSSYLEVDTKKDTSEFKFVVEKETLLTGTVVSSDKKTELSIKLDLSLFMEGGQNAEMTLGIINEMRDNGSNTEIKIGVEQGSVTQQLSMVVDTTVTYDEKITKPNVSNAVLAETVDEKVISENLLKALEGSNLYDILSTYLEDMDFNSDINNQIEYSEHCDDASNCKCDGDICSCRYLNKDWDYEDIICPNPNN